MKGLYVYNGGLVTPKFIEIKDLFVEAFAKKGVELVAKMNDEMRFCKEDFDFCLFYDKDISLCMDIERRMPTFNSSDCIALCDDKCLTASALADWVKMPKQITSPLIFFGTQSASFIQKAGETLGYPIVVKCAKGSFGEQVMLAKNKEELSSLVLSLGSFPFVLQEFIEAKGEDKRIYVVDGKVIGGMRRRATNGDFRSNITIGGEMEICSVSDQEAILAIEACRGVKALFAGVDVIGKEEDPILLEVNSNAHFKNFLDCTGINVAEFIAEAILKQV